MSKISDSIYDIGFLDDLARKRTVIHRLNPLAKLLTTFSYLVIIVSMGKYEISRLLPFALYPVVLFSASEVPLMPLIKRLLLLLPLMIGIGIFNPVFDRSAVILSGFTLSGGWISFLSVLIKYVLCVTAALLLIATTGMDRIAAALRKLHVHKLFVLQLLLTYRYISLLAEEAGRLTRAYALKALEHSGIKPAAWGSLLGQLLLRTFDRAQRIYQAMCLRGFTGEFNLSNERRLVIGEVLYIFCWTAFFAAARIFDIPALIGTIFV